MNATVGFTYPSGVPKIGPFSKISAHGRALRTVEQGCESVRALLNGSIFGKPQAAPVGRPFLLSLSFGRAKERDSHACTIWATKARLHWRVKYNAISKTNFETLYNRLSLLGNQVKV